MADFITQHCGPEVSIVELAPWALFFDGSSCGAGSRIGIILISPRGESYEFLLSIEASATSNQAEYQGIWRGIQLLREIKEDVVEIFGDSMLIVGQLTRACECRDDILRTYYEVCLRLLKEFKSVTIEHIPRVYNEDANKLAKHASGYRPICGALTLELVADDWRKDIADYLRDPSKKADRRIRFQALKYILLEDELYYRTIDGVLLKCLAIEEAKNLIGEIHEGVCGAHQSAFKMK